MSFNSFNPFAPNPSINTRRDSARSTRPPTYTSAATAAPTYTPNERGTTSAHDRSEGVRPISSYQSTLMSFAPNPSINTHRDSARNTRSPTYTSATTAAPTYTPNERRTTSAHDRSESVRAWSARISSAQSVGSLGSDTVSASSLTDAVSVEESPAENTRPAEPRYIYYRVYAEDGAIPSFRPVYSDDPYLGRIKATMVALPHTARSLRRCLSSIEHIDRNTRTRLFIATSSQTPMEDAGRVSILANPGPGCTPNEPMVLVANISGPLADRNPELGRLPPGEHLTPFITQYLYYRAYNDCAAVLSKWPAGSEDPTVGRISVDCIPPPHTAASIMRCLAKNEEFEHSKESQLFINISSEFPIGEGHVSILSSNRPGYTPEDPIVFVNCTPQDVGEITVPAGPRYVYYRVYEEGGAIPSANPVYSDDSSLGRILPELVAPPATVATLRDCLFSVENISNTPARLFMSASSQTPMDDTNSLSIFAYPGPGCTPNEPVALVISSSDAGNRPLNAKKPEAVLLPSQEGTTPFEAQYMYYRVYNKHGEPLLKYPAYSTNRSVGRINVNSVAPPHTAMSIMHCISKTERLWKPNEPQLFVSISSESPIGEEYVSLLTSDCPGSTPEDPMVFVDHTPYTKYIQVTAAWNSEDPRFLVTTSGEILRTDGLLQVQSMFHGGSTHQGLSVFEAINATGRVGFAHQYRIKDCGT